ncbi:hypothetical protein [Vibrio anguillarum]|uniref:Uncharacterized protein n=1 Tax=Vibrio anguillarum TaxID=55601 RepID=A0AAW4BKX7_VIBAN|nr:hypothetical protein [Vibrio anguillarum]MBF4374432.1 hypothetical protein [Vibrio anguillarum]MBF4437734.1 hypothetical protein [Vibrio anguillarum]
MKFDDLSEEAQQVLVGMVEHCINQGVCMGMDEGIECFDTNKKHSFREELEAFVNANELEYE